MSGAVDGGRPLPTLAFALLALLARDPSTGYELAQRLKDPIGFFWQARHTQIYPQLAALERRAMVTSAEEPGPGPRARRRYTVTSDGLTALRAWIDEPSRRRAGRDELLLKVYASWVAEPSATLRLLRIAEADHAARLALYLERQRRARDRGVGDAPMNDPRFTDYATLRRGIGFERGRLAWCRWLIRRVEAEQGA